MLQTTGSQLSEPILLAMMLCSTQRSEVKGRSSLPFHRGDSGPEKRGLDPGAVLGPEDWVARALSSLIALCLPRSWPSDRGLQGHL